MALLIRSSVNLEATLRCASLMAAALALGIVASCNVARSESASTSTAGEAASDWTIGPSLPRPVANNAVVGLDLLDESHVYSFMGIDSTKRWDGVVSSTFRWVVGSDSWEELTPVPGPGRLAGTAEAIAGKVYLFGGYTVAEDGSEASVPNVDVFDPTTDLWSSAAPMPVPVDDAISGVWRDSLVVLVSGWHNTDNVADVQLYNPHTDSWSMATSIPGAPVFGHAGKVAGDRVVYVGGANTQGVRRRYRIEPSAWVGDFNPSAGESIIWQPLGDHPGPLRYRAASVAVGNWVVFAGGTDNPYNYNGTGYDGASAQPTTSVFGFHGPTGSWNRGPALPEARMDHRALARAGEYLVLVGGMDAQQSVRADVFLAQVDTIVGRLNAALRDAGLAPSP